MVKNIRNVRFRLRFNSAELPFCRRCGHPFPPHTQPLEPVQKKKKKRQCGALLRQQQKCSWEHDANIIGGRWEVEACLSRGCFDKLDTCNSGDVCLQVDEIAPQLDTSGASPLIDSDFEEMFEAVLDRYPPVSSQEVAEAEERKKRGKGQVICCPAVVSVCEAG